MAFNVPTGDTAKLSFGPGKIFLGPVGSTPTIEVGFVKGDSELSVARTLLEVFAGSPQSIIKQYAIKEEVSMKFTGIEWNLDNIAYALGAGVTSVSGADDIFEFGGDMDVSQRALRFLHIQPDGSTVDVHLLQAEGSGELAIALKETDMHEFPMTFKAIEASLDFEGAVPAENKKKFKIIRTKV